MNKTAAQQILHFVACLAFSAAFLTVSAFGFLALIILQANS